MNTFKHSFLFLQAISLEQLAELALNITHAPIRDIINSDIIVHKKLMLQNKLNFVDYVYNTKRNKELF